MAKLTFDTKELAALLADAQRAWAADPTVRTYCGMYDEQGFWLVGDEGVYLMHNGKTSARVNGAIMAGDVFNGEKIAVVYAKESDPRKGDTWDSKRALFGADDGIELLARQSVEAWIASLIKHKQATGSINITPDAITIVSPL